MADGDSYSRTRRRRAALCSSGHAARRMSLHPADRPTRPADVNLNASDVDGSAAFYEKALGFRLTDRTRAMAFVRCNDDHHAVVIADAPVNCLNHVAFLMPNLEAVMRGFGPYDRRRISDRLGPRPPRPGRQRVRLLHRSRRHRHRIHRRSIAGGRQLCGARAVAMGLATRRTDHWGIAPAKADHVKAAQTAVPYADA